MTIVNPYLKKKKPLSGGGGGELRGRKVTSTSSLLAPPTRTSALPSRHITPNKTDVTDNKISSSTPSSVRTNQKSYSTTGSSSSSSSSSAFVTPGKPMLNTNERKTPNTLQASHKPGSSSDHSHQTVTNVASQTKQELTLSGPRSNLFSKSTSFSSCHVQKSTIKTATNTTSRSTNNTNNNNGKKNYVAVSTTTKSISLKQQLKQEIAMLKKQKQLQKLQKEAEQRRQKIQKEKQEQVEKECQQQQRQRQQQQLKQKQKQQMEQRQKEQDVARYQLELQLQNKYQNQQQWVEQPQQQLQRIHNYCNGLSSYTTGQPIATGPSNVYGQSTDNCNSGLTQHQSKQVVESSHDVAMQVPAIQPNKDYVLQETTPSLVVHSSSVRIEEKQGCEAKTATLQDPSVSIMEEENKSTNDFALYSPKTLKEPTAKEGDALAKPYETSSATIMNNRFSITNEYSVGTTNQPARQQIQGILPTPQLAMQQQLLAGYHPHYYPVSFTPAFQANPYYDNYIGNMSSFAYPFMQLPTSHSSFPSNTMNSWVDSKPHPSSIPLPSRSQHKPRRIQSTKNVSKTDETNKHSSSTILCNPLMEPSPFASEGRQLIGITLIRNPQTDKSFGVTLITRMVSKLVDHDLYEVHQQKLCCENQKQKEEEEIKHEPKFEPKFKEILMPQHAIQTENVVKMENKHPNTEVKRHHSCLGQTSTKFEIEPVKASDIGVTEIQFTTKQNSNTNTTSESCIVQTSEFTNTAAYQEGVETINVEAKDNFSEHSSRQEVRKKNVDAETGILPVTSDENKEGNNEILNVAIVDHSVNGVSSQMESERKHTMKKQRRRMDFTVMMISDATQQNNRLTYVELENKLQHGDIVLTIGGEDVSGKKFLEACKMFSSKAMKVNDTLIQIEILVARKKALEIPVRQNIELNKTNSSEPALKVNMSMDFVPSEIAILMYRILMTLNHPMRMLGQEISESLWQQTSCIFGLAAASMTDNPLTLRSSDILKRKWLQLSHTMMYNLANKASNYWTNKLRDESDTEKLPFSSDAERSAMRHLPRPSRGCRCGQEDHEYLFESKCVLYSDIRKRLSKEELESLLPQQKKSIGKSGATRSKELNAVESAFKNRIVKLKEVSDNEAAEARFVAKMEEIQVKEMKKAVFAPNLSSMVLSSIFELQREFPIPLESIALSEDEVDDEEDDEEDDLPLLSLGKRKSLNAGDDNGGKQRKMDDDYDPKIDVQYLLRLLEYLSKTWGHCYHEPSHEENAWRWELFHGLFSTGQQWEAQTRNPRVPNSLPLENIQFGLIASKESRKKVSFLPEIIKRFEDSILLRTQTKNDIIIEKLVGNREEMIMQKEIHGADNVVPSSSTVNVTSTVRTLDVSDELLDQFCLAIYLLSPYGTGVYDELLALMKMDVIKIRSGIPVLTSDWSSNVDVHILDDMAASWSTEADPEGKYCMNDELRDTLEEQWIKYDYGWAIADDPKELIFDYSVIDEWRETFEGRLEQKANHTEGIGRFGL